jgi:hypothetical protein
VEHHDHPRRHEERRNRQRFTGGPGYDTIFLEDGDNSISELGNHNNIIVGSGANTTDSRTTPAP